jgi:hypothetical protein
MKRRSEPEHPLLQNLNRMIWRFMAYSALDAGDAVVEIFRDHLFKAAKSYIDVVVSCTLIPVVCEIHPL